jgi:hypothetical protein
MQVKSHYTKIKATLKVAFFVYLFVTYKETSD